MQPPYPAILAAVLGAIVLAGVFYIYRHERRLESLSMSGPAAEKTESSRPLSRQFLINEIDLESGPEVEGEDDRNSLCYEAPMTARDSSRPSIPPLAFDDTRLVHRLDDPLVPPPPRSNSATFFPTQPSVALLSKGSPHARRGSDTVALTRPGVRGATYPNDVNGAETARSSMASASASSILPPSYHSHYLSPRNPQSQPVAESSKRPVNWEDKVRGEGAEEDGAVRPRRSFDGGVRLAGGCPGEDDSGASGADGVSGMPPTYHDL